MDELLSRTRAVLEEKEVEEERRAELLRLQQLGTSPVQVVVYGQTGHGKSSLVNAVLGSPVCSVSGEMEAHTARMLQIINEPSFRRVRIQIFPRRNLDPVMKQLLRRFIRLRDSLLAEGKVEFSLLAEDECGEEEKEEEEKVEKVEKVEVEVDEDAIDHHHDDNNNDYDYMATPATTTTATRATKRDPASFEESTEMMEIRGRLKLHFDRELLEALNTIATAEEGMEMIRHTPHWQSRLACRDALEIQEDHLHLVVARIAMFILAIPSEFERDGWRHNSKLEKHKRMWWPWIEKVVVTGPFSASLPAGLCLVDAPGSGSLDPFSQDITESQKQTDREAAVVLVCGRYERLRHTPDFFQLAEQFLATGKRVPFLLAATRTARVKTTPTSTKKKLVALLKQRFPAGTWDPHSRQRLMALEVFHTDSPPMGSPPSLGDLPARLISLVNEAKQQRLRLWEAAVTQLEREVKENKHVFQQRETSRVGATPEIRQAALRQLRSREEISTLLEKEFSPLELTNRIKDLVSKEMAAVVDKALLETKQSVSQLLCYTLMEWAGSPVGWYTPQSLTHGSHHATFHHLQKCQAEHLRSNMTEAQALDSFPHRVACHFVRNVWKLESWQGKFHVNLAKRIHAMASARHALARICICI